MNDNSSSTAIEELLRDPGKKVFEATGVLSRIFRQLLVEIDLEEIGFYRLLNDWLNDPANGVSNDFKRRSSARGNFIKELVRPSMTWKVFLKAVKLLKPNSVEFSFGFQFGYKKYTVSQVYKISDIKIPDDDNDTGDIMYKEDDDE